MYRLAVNLMIIMVFAIPCYAGPTTYQDVLDTPATKSLIADKTLLNGVTFTGKRLISVGWRGHIVFSDDQGKRWIQASVPVSCDLTAVYFPSPQRGWAVGHDGVVLHSSDGGVTWVKQLDGRTAAQIMFQYYNSAPKNLPGQTITNLMEEVKRFVQEGPDKPFLDVWFKNDEVGFIVGAFNLIFRTSNGGKSWEPWFDRTDNPERLHLYSIKNIDQDLFIAGEQGIVLKLDQKLDRFRRIKTPYKGTFFGIAGKKGLLTAFGLRGNIFYSLDLGNNWQKMETGILVGLTGATVTGDGKVVLVSQEGHVISISNGEKKLEVAKIESHFPAAAVTSLDSNALVLAGPLGVQIVPIKEKKEN